MAAAPPNPQLLEQVRGLVDRTLQRNIKGLEYFASPAPALGATPKDVLLTRGTDTYIALRERVARAQAAKADLFLSLHADSHPDADVRGASVYTVSEKGAERVGLVLDKNDWLMKANLPGRDRAVSQILLDLSQRATKNRSATFAQLLLANVGEETALLRRSHRDAGFFVLLAPDVPAVLLEMGFITNPEDEAFLTNKASRARLVDAVGDSIEAYFSAGSRKS